MAALAAAIATSACASREERMVRRWDKTREEDWAWRMRIEGELNALRRQQEKHALELTRICAELRQPLDAGAPPLDSAAAVTRAECELRARVGPFVTWLYLVESFQRTDGGFVIALARRLPAPAWQKPPSDSELASYAAHARLGSGTVFVDAAGRATVRTYVDR